jgi:Ca2+-binding RTX toxin-like protein
MDPYAVHMRKTLIVFIVLAASSTAFGVPSASAANIIGGTNGADTITGTAGRDIIFGKGGNDVIRGMGGNDLIFGGGGADKLIGGAGDDTLVDDDGTSGDILRGGPGFDTLYSLDGGKDTLDCGPDGGVAFADTFDTVKNCTTVIRRNGSYKGRVVIVGGNGNSVVNQPRNAAYIFGRNGNDTLRGSKDNDIIFGGGGNDILQGFNGDDVFVDDDSANNEAIQTGGQDGDIVYAADGAKTSITCTDKDNDASTAVVFADSTDTTFNCGHVISSRSSGFESVRGGGDGSRSLKRSHGFSRSRHGLPIHRTTDRLMRVCALGFRSNRSTSSTMTSACERSPFIAAVSMTTTTSSQPRPKCSVRSC